MREVNGSEYALWITKQDALPDVCIDCGAFSDRRVKVTGITTHKTWVTRDETGKTVLGCLCFLLGPIGWLINLVGQTSKVEYRQKEVRIKKSINVPRCDFCRAESVRGDVELDLRSAGFAFYAHPRFKSEFERLNDWQGTAT